MSDAARTKIAQIMRAVPITFEREAELASMLFELAEHGPGVLDEVKTVVLATRRAAGNQPGSYFDGAGRLCQVLGLTGGDAASAFLRDCLVTSSDVWEYARVRKGAFLALAYSSPDGPEADGLIRSATEHGIENAAALASKVRRLREEGRVDWLGLAEPYPLSFRARQQPVAAPVGVRGTAGRSPSPAAAPPRMSKARIIALAATGALTIGAMVLYGRDLAEKRGREHRLLEEARQAHARRIEERRRNVEKIAFDAEVELLRKRVALLTGELDKAGDKKERARIGEDLSRATLDLARAEQRGPRVARPCECQPGDPLCSCE